PLLLACRARRGGGGPGRGLVSHRSAAHCPDRRHRRPHHLPPPAEHRPVAARRGEQDQAEQRLRFCNRLFCRPLRSPMVRAMASRPLNPSERLDWLRLIRTENVGPVTFYQLLSRFGSAGAALEALPGLATRGGRRVPLTPYPRSFAERELAVAEKAGIALIA